MRKLFSIAILLLIINLPTHAQATADVRVDSVSVVEQTLPYVIETTVVVSNQGKSSANVKVKILLPSYLPLWSYPIECTLERAANNLPRALLCELGLLEAGNGYNLFITSWRAHIGKTAFAVFVESNLTDTDLSNNFLIGTLKNN